MAVPAKEFSLIVNGQTFRSDGRNQFTVGGGANDDVDIITWDPGRLSFVRGADGWTVTDVTGYGLTVNGVMRTKWRIGNPHTIVGHQASIEIVPDGADVSPDTTQPSLGPLPGQSGRPPTLEDLGPPPNPAPPPAAAPGPAPTPSANPAPGPPRFGAPPAPSPGRPQVPRNPNPPAAPTPYTPGGPSPYQSPAPIAPQRPSAPLVAFDRRSSGPQRYTVGRSANAQVVVDDLRVAPSHAEIRLDGNTGARVVDLGARGGTYVDGRRVQGSVQVQAGQTISFGSTRLQVQEQNGQIQIVDVSDQLGIEADAVQIVIDEKEIVRSVSMQAHPGELIAVLGPSGSGKSTVVRSLAGGRAPAMGAIRVNGESLYAEGSGLRQQVGYVPQDDILHHQLTVEAALAYTADLRFPDSTPVIDRQRRVVEVITELGLGPHANTRIDALSGGQRKRVNVATELLTAPSLLFLDEPTSGLDPGYEKEVMLLLRHLADAGRTIMVVTHSMQSLDVCDKLLIMARGGQQAFFGAPNEALQYFGVPSLADVFIALEREDRDWQGEWEARVQPHAQPVGRQTRPRPIALRSQTAQFITLIRRYVEVLSRDGRQMALTVAQGPFIALLMIFVMGSGFLSMMLGGPPGPGGEPPGPPRASPVLLALTLGATYVGLSGAVREIVKELPILRRERAAGVGFGPYVISKALVLGAITCVQAFVLVVLGTARQDPPSDASVLFDGRVELIVAVAVTGIASVAMGLFISTLVEQQDKAMLVLPIILFAQFVLAGVSFAIDQPVLEQLSALMPARWGFSAVASTVDLPALTADCRDRGPGGCPEAWQRGADHWLTSMTWLVILVALYTALAICMLAWRESRNRL